jgi:anthranilate synthase component 2
MILLIDNYDSFSFNLYQLLGEFNPDIRVIRNDEKTVEQIADLDPECIVLSPGPGRPERAGVIVDVVRKLGERIPILGVCLGHQAICAAYGATITYAGRMMHGKQSRIRPLPGCALFAGCPEEFPVARYHSLAADESTLPPCLLVTARTQDGEVMAVQHREYHVDRHFPRPERVNEIQTFFRRVRRQDRGNIAHDPAAVLDLFQIIRQDPMPLFRDPDQNHVITVAVHAFDHVDGRHAGNLMFR